MGEALREIAQRLTGIRIGLLGKEAEMVAAVQGHFKDLAGSLNIALDRQI